MPFVPLRIGDCISCLEEEVELNIKDECTKCNTEYARIKNNYAKKGIISVLCDTHSVLVQKYCVNNHRLYGNGGYAFGTLLCFSCYQTTPKICLGCAKEHKSRNKDLCETCQTKVNNNICTKCGQDSLYDYIDNAGRCQNCQ